MDSGINPHDKLSPNMHRTTFCQGENQVSPYAILAGSPINLSGRFVRRTNLSGRFVRTICPPDQFVRRINLSAPATSVADPVALASDAIVSRYRAWLFGSAVFACTRSAPWLLSWMADRAYGRTVILYGSIGAREDRTVGKR